MIRVRNILNHRPIAHRCLNSMCVAAVCLSLSACSSVNLPMLRMLQDAQAPAVATVDDYEIDDSGTKWDTQQAAEPAAFVSIGNGYAHTNVSPISYQPAEARRGVVSLGNIGQSVSEIITPSDSVHDFPDEYLFDGGDRAKPVHYEDNIRAGLDTEDTVGEFADHTGERHVQRSNRVAIYAPRFAAVRTISGSRQGLAVNRVAGAHKATGGFNVAGREGITMHTDTDRLGGLRMRSRPSSVNVDARDRHYSRVFKRSEHVLLQNAFEDRSFSQRGQFNRTSSAWLADGMQNASAWAADTSVSITATTAAAVEVKAELRAQSMIGIDDGKRTKGTLRIMKLADVKIAKPGDEVTFTLRYDNLGDHDLYDVVIIDNLTPRLEYIEDSEDSNRAGELVVEDNGRGSHILKFVIDDPLPGHEGGVLSFRARVR